LKLMRILESFVIVSTFVRIALPLTQGLEVRD
jgi:hypothetical protein